MLQTIFAFVGFGEFAVVRSGERYFWLWLVLKHLTKIMIFLPVFVLSASFVLIVVVETLYPMYSPDFSNAMFSILWFLGMWAISISSQVSYFGVGDQLATNVTCGVTIVVGFVFLIASFAAGVLGGCFVKDETLVREKWSLPKEFLYVALGVISTQLLNIFVFSGVGFIRRIETYFQLRAIAGKRYEVLFSLILFVVMAGYCASLQNPMIAFLCTVLVAGMLFFAGLVMMMEHRMNCWVNVIRPVFVWVVSALLFMLVFFTWVTLKVEVVRKAIEYHQQYNPAVDVLEGGEEALGLGEGGGGEAEYLELPSKEL